MDGCSQLRQLCEQTSGNDRKQALKDKLELKHIFLPACYCPKRLLQQKISHKTCCLMKYIWTTFGLIQGGVKKNDRSESPQQHKVSHQDTHGSSEQLL